MKILVIFTGGTIGSSENGGIISTDPGANYRLINEYEKTFGGDVEFIIRSPYEILSENLTARELTLLIKCICDGINGGYDGIIVTHGTDTLQYSAAAAAFCAGCECIPVMFVSSNLPLENEMSNGHANFDTAVRFIRGRAGRGVYTCYQNERGGPISIHLATRMLRHPEFSDKIFSFGNTPYAVFREGIIKKCPDFVPSDYGTPCGPVEFREDPSLLTIHASPAEHYRYDLSRYRAAVLVPYHSGTLCTASRNLKDFCDDAARLGVPVFLPGVPKGAAYGSMLAYGQLGIKVLPRITFASVIMKIWIAESINADIKEFAAAPLAQEFNP